MTALQNRFDLSCPEKSDFASGQLSAVQIKTQGTLAQIRHLIGLPVQLTNFEHLRFGTVELN